MMKDERYKKFCKAKAPALGVEDKSPACDESAIISGSLVLMEPFCFAPQTCLTLD